jgi:hypothetical protein
MLDRHDCYELCVQSPRHVAAFLHALHPGAIVLREDFCGTGSLAVRWIQEGLRIGDMRRSLAVDMDPDPLAKGRSAAASLNVTDQIQWRCEDALSTGPSEPADIIFVGNFSIGYIHDRKTLVRYFKACVQRLKLGNHGFGGGVFVCDTYGGATAFQLGGFERKHPSRGREIIRYQWMHESADPLTGMVENSISFRIELDGEIIHELPRAFTYRWRLWSLTELKDAMLDAGFVSTEIHRDVNVAPGETPMALAPGDELPADYIVLVVGRT